MNILMLAMLLCPVNVKASSFNDIGVIVEDPLQYHGTLRFVKGLVREAVEKFGPIQRQTIEFAEKAHLDHSSVRERDFSEQNNDESPAMPNNSRVNDSDATTSNATDMHKKAKHEKARYSVCC